MDRQTPFVSIIVPVYNTQAYLEHCIDSLISQNLSQIEIILIDDGSTDGSGAICDKYAENDVRVRVIHKKNEGQSVARNYGIALAQGEYVMFVDSDDWVMPDYCELPYSVAQKYNADLVLFCANYYSDTGELVEPPVLPLPDGELSKEDAFRFLDKGIDNTPWNKLYRKSLFDRIQFPQGVFYEDIGTIYKTIYEAQTICFSSARLYNYYLRRSGSITSQKNIKKTTDMFDMLFQKIHDIKGWGYDCSEYEIRQALSYLVLLGRHNKYSKESASILRNANHIPENFSRKEKVLFRVFRLSPFLFDCLSMASGKRYKD